MIFPTNAEHGRLPETGPERRRQGQSEVVKKVLPSYACSQGLGDCFEEVEMPCRVVFFWAE